MRWYGVDFSGDVHKWGPGVSEHRSKVWIASVSGTGQALCLEDLCPVQALPGETGEHPFCRLVNLLKQRDFEAAGIDAPFALPRQYARLMGTHRDLLCKVLTLRREGRPFPRSTDFVAAIRGHEARTEPPKPLRQTEREGGVNARSTLWAGPRGGAAMTAACLTLLARAQNPRWPWDRPPQAGLLVEAFPAAQLKLWGLPHQRYDGAGGDETRRTLTAALSCRLRVSERLRSRLLASADALDAVVCAFGAIAVTQGLLHSPPCAAVAEDEGWIALHK